MAVGFDAATESHTGTTGASGAASFTWDHTGGASARGALVFVFGVVTNALPPVTSVTYGGATMAAVPYNAKDSDTEPGSVIAYYLDNVATGTQAVVVNRSDATPWAHVLYAVCFTVTAASATGVIPGLVMTHGGSTSNTGASSLGSGTGTVALKSVNDDSPGTNSLRFMGRFQGTSNVTAAGSGSTAGPSIDFGLYVIDTFRETTAGQGARNVGGATITDDVAAIALAVVELAPKNPQPTALALVTSWSTPSVVVNVWPQPTALALTFTGATPTVTVTTNQLVLPAVLALTWTGATPIVSTPIVTLPTALALTLSFATPIVATPIAANPAALALAIAFATPAVLTPVVVVPTALAMAWTGATPTVLTPVALAPAALALALTLETPAVSTPILTTPAALALAWTGDAPVVLTPVASLPDALALAWTGAVPSVLVPIAIAPPTLALGVVGAVPDVAVSGGSGVVAVPEPFALLLSLFAPTVTTTGQSDYFRPLRPLRPLRPKQSRAFSRGFGAMPPPKIHRYQARPVIRAPRPDEEEDEWILGLR